MSALTQKLPPHFEWDYVDAPSLAEGDYGWWRAIEPSPQTSASAAKGLLQYAGWERSRKFLCERLARSRYDGIFGFSQGAAMTSLLVGLRSRDQSRSEPWFNFAVMVGGFESRDPSHAQIYARQGLYALPTLHLIGAVDQIVAPETSLALAARFQRAEVVMHRGGHIVPSDHSSSAKVASFLDACALMAEQIAPGLT
jgi:predicted esterase